ncbi:nucleotidyltransferase family protein [bacterium]|nr:nucleotidyltransferase family protein [bacterium]
MFVLPDLSFNRDFHKGSNNSFVRQLLSIDNSASEETRQIYATNEKEAIVREKHLSDVISFLHKEGIRAIPLKGLYLLKTIFKDFPGLRTMADIDVLVEKRDFSKSKRVLTKFGALKPFADGHYCYSKIYHEFSVKYSGSTIEIHRGQSVFNLFKMDYSDFFREGESIVDNYGVEIFLPPIEMMIIFYIVHDFSDGLSSEQPLSYEKMSRMLTLLHNADRIKLTSLAKKYGVSTLLNLYDYILGKVFFHYSADTEESSWWFSAIIATGLESQPLRFRYSDTLFKMLIFKGNLIRKLLPRIFCSPFDTLYRW